MVRATAKLTIVPISKPTIATVEGFRSPSGPIELANRYVSYYMKLFYSTYPLLAQHITAELTVSQIYRTDYVLYHFVHYSTVTKALTETYAETLARGGSWKQRLMDRSQRVTDELNEAVMIHTKSIKREMTTGYEKRCRFDYDKKWQGCWVAVPHPKEVSEHAYDENGFEYNCYINEKVETYWAPKLREAMLKRKTGHNK